MSATATWAGRACHDTNGPTVACLRLDDKIRWCYEHIAPVGTRAEMLRIRNEPVPGLLVGQVFRYVDDFDLDGAVDTGSTTLLQRETTCTGWCRESSSTAVPTAAINSAETFSLTLAKN